MQAPDRSTYVPPPAPELMGQASFRAMNTNVAVYMRSPDDVASMVGAEDVFHELEERLSRFKPESELCRLNERSGETVQVSPVMIDILSQAQALHRLTGGLFEPGILPDLEAAGYDRSFELVDGVGGDLPEERPADGLSIAQMEVDRERSTVRAPEGLRIDLGGIGKGYAVDAASALLAPVRDFVVSAGGDMFASGCGVDGDGWLTSVVDPFGSGEAVSLIRLHDEALATSTTAIRRWERRGRLLHHLIDPTTRRPAESEVVSASVIAETATRADVFAKTCLLLGPTRGRDFLRRNEATGLFVLQDRRLVSSDDWPGTEQPARQEVLSK